MGIVVEPFDNPDALHTGHDDGTLSTIEFAGAHQPEPGSDLKAGIAAANLESSLDQHGPEIVVAEIVEEREVPGFENLERNCAEREYDGAQREHRELCWHATTLQAPRTSEECVPRTDEPLAQEVGLGRTENRSREAVSSLSETTNE